MSTAESRPWLATPLIAPYATVFLYLAGWIRFAVYLSALGLSPRAIPITVDAYVIKGFEASEPAIIALLLGIGISS